MENMEVEKSKVFIVVETIEYIPNTVVIKTSENPMFQPTIEENNR